MSEHIDNLDASLAKRGEDIVLRRVVAGVNRDVTVRAHVRSYRLNAEELAKGIYQIPFIVNISLTQIRAAGWPEGAPAPASPPFNVDPAIPVIGDLSIIKGVPRTVKTVDPIAVNGEVVRVKMMVLG